jgi:hypothetical protein
LRPLPDYTTPQCGSGTFRQVHLKWQFVTSWVVEGLKNTQEPQENKGFLKVHPAGDF